MLLSRIILPKRVNNRMVSIITGEPRQNLTTTLKELGNIFIVGNICVFSLTTSIMTQRYIYNKFNSYIDGIKFKD